MSKILIGAATAAHQVEGNNKKSDMWVLENVEHSSYKEPSLDAVDHYNRYKEDISILAQAGLNSYRFSIEWARIQPHKDVFDQQEIEHYREVLQYCKELNIVPIVTLHHFSSPAWLISEGGWNDEKTVEYFARYTDRVVAELGSMIPYICTINEANMGVQLKRLVEKLQKQQKVEQDVQEVQVGLNLEVENPMMQGFIEAGEAFGIEPDKVAPFLSPRGIDEEGVVLKSHMRAREVIKAHYPEIQVGLTMSLYDYQPLAGGEEFAQKLLEEDFLHYLPYIKEDDFFGAQNYTRKIVGAEGIIPPPEGTRVTDVGNEFYPSALAGVLKYVSEVWDKPIMVTENGLATTNDEMRVEFIEETFKNLKQCLAEGINLIGYIHWSLLDNFEWQIGYGPKFGLIAVDRATQKRYPKKSLTVLGEINKAQ
jgi:Beta-glucosidase/6-phospho-beta-glucosidase/beta-galactosidase